MTKLSHFRWRGRRKQSGGGILLGCAAVAFILSLGVLLRVQAMPVEARTEEIWYAYQQRLTYSFIAKVDPSAGIYARPEVLPEELLRQRIPVDPPVYRRVLVTSLTESIRLRLDYLFEGDRPADLTAVYQVDGILTIPNLWQRSFPLSESQELKLTGSRLAIEGLYVEIPVREIVDEMRDLTEQLKLGHDQAEIRVRPMVKLFATGLREPVAVGLSPEYVISIRGTNFGIEIDEPTTTTEQQTYGESKVTPIMVSVLGYTATVAALRQFSLIALAVFALLLMTAMLLRWLRTRVQHEGSHNPSRLGSALIDAKGFELPPDATVVDVNSIDQLIVLHLQTDRPVIRVADMYYLLDGGTCYRFSLLAAVAAAAEPTE